MLVLFFQNVWWQHPPAVWHWQTRGDRSTSMTALYMLKRDSLDLTMFLELWNSQKFQWNHKEQVMTIIIMYIYHMLINILSTHIIHINLNMIFYTHVEHSPIKNNLHKVLYGNTDTHTLQWIQMCMTLIGITHACACVHTHTHTHTHWLCL